MSTFESLISERLSVRHIPSNHILAPNSQALGFFSRFKFKGFLRVRSDHFIRSGRPSSSTHNLHVLMHNLTEVLKRIAQSGLAHKVRFLQQLVPVVVRNLDPAVAGDTSTFT